MLQENNSPGCIFLLSVLFNKPNLKMSRNLLEFQLQNQKDLYCHTDLLEVDLAKI